MKKIVKVLLWVLQRGILIFLLIAGVGSMPSVMGMLFLMMAVYITPGQMRASLLEDKIMRIVWIAFLIFYFSYLPSADIETAGKNMGTFLYWIWKGLQMLR